MGIAFHRLPQCGERNDFARGQNTRVLKKRNPSDLYVILMIV